MRIWTKAILFILAAAATVVAAEPVLEPHPRLYLNREAKGKVPGLAELKARTTDPAYADIWLRVRESRTPENIALVYLLTGDTTEFGRLREELRRVVDRYEPLVQRALAFDWAHGAFSAAEKVEFACSLTASSAALLRRYPMDCVYHNFTRGQHMGRGLAMLAAWDDDPEIRKLYPEIERQLGELLEILADGARLDDMDGRAGFGGGWPEGYDYDRHGGLYALKFLLGWRSAGLGDHFSGSRYWRDKTDWLLHGTSPDGSIIHGYEDNDFPFPMRHDREMLTVLAREYGDGRAVWWIDSFADTLEPRPFLEFIFTDRSVKPSPPEALPTGYLVPGLGLALMRSSWERDASYVAFHCGPWYTYHQHAAQGSFTAWRGRPLVIEPGVYDGEVNKLYVNWRIRSISHNCLLVFDPEERFHGPEAVPNPANDGGQMIQNWTLKPGNMTQWREQKKLRSSGEVTLFLNDSSHDLAAGEAANAYAPGKVHRWNRQLLFLKPDWVVVCDLASARAELPKTMVFHSLQQLEPRGDGASAADGFRAWSLLPSGAKLEVNGGPGKTIYYGGENFEVTPAYNTQVDVAWRLKVEAPREESTVFLTAIHLTEPGNSAERQVELLESGPERVSLRLDGKYEVSFTPGEPERYSVRGPGLTYSISGTVAPGGLANEGARVSLSGPKSGNTATDSRGGFLFQGLSPGEYTLRLEQGGESRKVVLVDHSVGGVRF